MTLSFSPIPLEELQTLWAKDSCFDVDHLPEENLRSFQLHARWWKIYSSERMILKKMEIEFKKLRLAKRDFYVLGPTKETIGKGWELPPRGKVLKTEAEIYVDCDQDIVEAALHLALQKEKVEFVQSIITDLVKNRNYALKGLLDWRKYLQPD